MESKSGKISVTTENIFPVIRQWLYEDKDIFIRELVSNCADAIAKHRRLVELGKAEKEPDKADYSIRVVYDDDNKTISFEDNGIGMTENEVEKYINQIAFSGALDFVTKYQQESTDKTGIIGHFGLGFYSAFMVADEVTINTKSFIEDAEPVIWKSNDGMDYEILPSDKKDRGTIITLKLSEDAIKIFDSATIRMTIRKYCYFAPADIYFVDTKSDRLHEEAEQKRKKEAEEKGETYTPSPVSYVPVNNKAPLWTK
jgi:molecular chaperone HtpG